MTTKGVRDCFSKPSSNLGGVVSGTSSIMIQEKVEENVQSSRGGILERTAGNYVHMIAIKKKSLIKKVEVGTKKSSTKEVEVSKK